MAASQNILQNRGTGLLMVLRITVEAASAFFITAYLINYGTASTAIGEYLVSLQPGVAACSLSLAVLAFWLAVTLVFGRVFCSTLCPMGALMDLMSRLRGSKRIYRYHKAYNGLRILTVALAALLLLIWAGGVFGWIDPFGLYSTLVRNLMPPRVAFATFASVVALLITLWFSVKAGRLACNTICPLGAVLGFLSRNAAFHIDINTDRCTQCRRCADVCKAQCINMDDHVCDMSRCVVCFDCLPECPNQAISYTLRRHPLSTPLMQRIKGNPKEKTSLACDNTLTSSPTSSKTEQ